MRWWGWLILGILVVLVGLLIFMYFFGRRMQKKQSEAEKQMEQMKQQVSALIIDKQKKKLTESGLPEAVINETPKYARRMKVPVVKCKVGPRIMTLIADANVYEILPLKKTCTLTVSGIYITEIKSVRGGSVPKPPVKKNAFRRMQEKLQAKLAKNKE